MNSILFNKWNHQNGRANETRKRISLILKIVVSNDITSNYH